MPRRSDRWSTLAVWAALWAALFLARPVHAQVTVTHSPPPGTCLGGTCQNQRTPLYVGTFDTPGLCSVARTTAIAGIVASALSIGGSAAIGLDDDLSRRKITSGVYLGATAVFTPLVALGAYSARKYCKVVGHPPSRKLGWIGFGGALVTALTAFVQTMRAEPPGLALTIGIGGIGTFGLLPHAFDSWMGYRQSRTPWIGFAPGPVSRVTVRF